MSYEIRDTSSEKPETQNSEHGTKIIGITGGIGSGKSTVSELIENFGFPVYNSDLAAKELVNRDEDLILKIKNLLGEEAYDEENRYNRKFVAEKVFNHQELLLQLNALIHPAVKIDFENWVAQQKNDFVFKETALLFELKLNETCYKTLLVTAEDNLRIKRVMDRDGKTYREVQTIIEKQMPEKEKIKLADFVIENNTTREELLEKTEIFIEKLKALPEENL